MSASNRGKVRTPIIGLWSANAGRLLAHQVQDGGGVWVWCARCRSWDPVNLARLVIERNPLFSLWNRRPPCPSCGGPLSFHGHHAPGAPVIAFITDDPRQTDDLHRAWTLEQRRGRGDDAGATAGSGAPCDAGASFQDYLTRRDRAVRREEKGQHLGGMTAMRLATSEFQFNNRTPLGAPQRLRPAVGFLRPGDVAKDPDLSLSEKRELLAAWASDASAVQDQPTVRWLLGTPDPVPLNEVLEALSRLDWASA